MKAYLETSLHEDDLPGYGSIPAEYVIVGMAPSPRRPHARRNHPFGASSNRVIRAIANLAPGRLYVTNLVKTPQPSGKKLKVALIRSDYPLLLKELEVVGPKRILAVGSPPAEVLCPGFKGLSSDHGMLFYNPTLDCVVVPTYHFVAVSRDPSLSKVVYRDLERFFTLPDPEPPEFVVLKKLPDIPMETSLFIDIETTGLREHEDQITKVGLTWGNQKIVYILENPNKRTLCNLHDLLVQKKPNVLVGHNVQFDIAHLMYHSGKPWDFPLEDTMLMAHELGYGSGPFDNLKLKHLTVMLTNRPGSHVMGGIEDNGYLAEDVLSTRELYLLLKERAHKVFSYSVMADLSSITAEMRSSGVYIDRDLLSELKPTYEGLVSEASIALNKFTKGVEVNWNSPQQVANFLLRHGVPKSRLPQTETGNLSVAAGVLDTLTEFEVVKVLLDYRDAFKNLSFIQSYWDLTSPEHPFLHPKLKLFGTSTGRTSMEDPNLQQVPRVGPIKLIFISRWLDGLMGLLDLSQAELRTAALLSGDREFTAMLLEEDAHRAIASILYQKPQEQIEAWERKRSKGITFGLLYGGSPFGLSSRIGVPIEEVEKVLQIFFERFEQLSKYIRFMKKSAVKTGLIQMPFGRVRNVEALLAKEGHKRVARVGINTPIQSTASDIALWVMNYLGYGARDANLYGRPIFGVHDSILLDIPAEEASTFQSMAQEAFLSLEQTPLSGYPLWKTLPFTGELVLGSSWAQIESTNENYDKEHNIYSPCSSHGC